MDLKGRSIHERKRTREGIGQVPIIHSQTDSALRDERLTNSRSTCSARQKFTTMKRLGQRAIVLTRSNPVHCYEDSISSISPDSSSHLSSFLRLIPTSTSSTSQEHQHVQPNDCPPHLRPSLPLASLLFHSSTTQRAVLHDTRPAYLAIQRKFCLPKLPPTTEG